MKTRTNYWFPEAVSRLISALKSHGRIVATDNGDATSHELFQSKSKKAYNGMCLVIVAAEKGAKSSFTVKADAKGLTGSSVKVDLAD